RHHRGYRGQDVKCRHHVVQLTATVIREATIAFAPASTAIHASSRDKMPLGITGRELIEAGRSRSRQSSVGWNAVGTKLVLERRCTRGLARAKSTTASR